jgi:hypothetical protein
LQMLAPVSAKCNWKRRMSSSVAVSGERLRNAANRLQLLMWPSGEGHGTIGAVQWLLMELTAVWAGRAP